MSVESETTTSAAEIMQGPAEDAIKLEREVGRTRASITLMSGAEVLGYWATGDCQALRRLIQTLVEVADGATASADRADRLVQDMAAGIRMLRDQLRTALNDVDLLHAEREELKADITHRTALMLAEITQLKAELDGARAQTMTPDVAKVAREYERLHGAYLDEKRRADEEAHEKERLQGAFIVERRRGDAAMDAMQDMAARFVKVDRDSFYTKAVEAAGAADLAFEEAKWKEGSRYLKLANTWIGLLNVVASPEVATEPIRTT